MEYFRAPHERLRPDLTNISSYESNLVVLEIEAVDKGNRYFADMEAI